LLAQQPAEVQTAIRAAPGGQAVAGLSHGDVVLFPHADDPEPVVEAEIVRKKL